MKVAIMLPTYNEAENIETLIRRILKVNKDFEIVVVDDNSPDGTGEILERLRDEFTNIHIVRRTGKRGRGTAGVLGFKECLKLDPDVIIEMDADLSHSPEFIPELLKHLKDADIAIASRYTQNGIDSRSLFRRALSNIANVYLSALTGLKLKDGTSGFRAFRSSTLRAIDLNRINSSGPSVVQEVLLNCVKNGAKFIEVPYRFNDRVGGKSKLSFWLLLKTFFKVTQLGLAYRFNRKLN